MLSEKRVIHMTHMEISRQKNEDAFSPLMNLDRRDYLSFEMVIGFIVGSLFYGVVAAAAVAGVLSMYFVDPDKLLLIGMILGVVIGYILFLFFYQGWYHKYCLERFRQARQYFRQRKRDWDILNEIYQEEKMATKPTINMDLLFPEGTLGENE